LGIRSEALDLSNLLRTWHIDVTFLRIVENAGFLSWKKVIGGLLWG
jgi:hypothetical protein